MNKIQQKIEEKIYYQDKEADKLFKLLDKWRQGEWGNSGSVESVLDYINKMILKEKKKLLEVIREEINKSWSNGMKKDLIDLTEEESKLYLAGASETAEFIKSLLNNK